MPVHEGSMPSSCHCEGVTLPGATASLRPPAQSGRRGSASGVADRSWGCIPTDADIERPARAEVKSDGRGAEMLLLTPRITMLHDRAQRWGMWAEDVARGSPRRRSSSYCK